MSKIRLTDEEKVMKKWYEKIVANKPLLPHTTGSLERFTKEYVKKVFKNTRFENDKIVVKEEKNPKNLGSMATSKNKASILKINFSKFLKGVNSSSEFKRFQYFYELQNTFNHETRHNFQLKEAMNFIPTTNGSTVSQCLEFAQEKLASSTEPYMFYSVEEGNYEDVLMEGDARRVGALKTATQMLRAIPNLKKEYKDFLIKKVIESIKEDNVEYKDIKYDGSYQKFNRGDVTSAYVDEYVATYPQHALETFEILSLEYKPDGTRRSFDELIKIRDSRLDKINLNKKINETTRKSLSDQINVAFSQIMHNELIRHANKEDIIDIRRRIGDKAFLNELEYIHNGRVKQAEERMEKYKEYAEFANNNLKIIKGSVKEEFKYELAKLVNKTGITTEIDSRTGREFKTLDDSKIKLLLKIGKEVSDTMNKYPRYTYDELEEANKKREEKNQKIKENLKQNFAIRKKEIKRKRQLEKEEEERKRKEAHKIKMKNPLYRIAYNITTRLQGNKPKRLPSANHREMVLSEKRDTVERLEKQKEELQMDFQNIKNESEELLIEAENRIYLDKQEKEQEIIKEEQIDEKGI